MNINFRKATPGDHESLEIIRLSAFAPVFSSFKEILGDEIYEAAQRKEDEDQKEILSEMFQQDSLWDLYVVESDHEISGFVSIKLDQESKVGEIGLNAVKPGFSGKGLGTKLYEFANDTMKAAGMTVATVATGGDKSHAPARRAYEKAGFNVQIPSVWYCRTL